MRQTFALVFGAALLAGAAVAAGQSTLPPPIPPVRRPPTTTPAPPPGSRTFAPPPARNEAAVIVGQVVDSNGRAVPKVAVRLIGDTTMATVLTDQRGRFFFRTMPQGEVVVTAQRFGFFDGAYGKHRATGQPLAFSLAYGQIVTDMRIELFAAGVITGFVVDEAGEPIVGARVVALRRQFVSGTWQHIEAGSEETDDEGLYRIFGLLPGEYIVSTPSSSFSVPVKVMDEMGRTAIASAGFGAVILAGVPEKLIEDPMGFIGTRGGATADGRNLVWTTATTPPEDDGRGGIYPVQFYPSTDQRILALPVAIGSGEVRYAVNFQIPLVPARRVTGRLIGDPKAMAYQIVRLMPAGGRSAPGDETATTLSEKDGTFAFGPVPIGRYALEAGNWGSMMRAFVTTLSDPDAEAQLSQGFWGLADVTVSDADVDVPNVLMQPTVAISGLVVFERPSGAGSNAAAPDRTVVTIEPGGSGQSLSSSVRVGKNGEMGVFRATNVVPGEYFVRVGPLPPGWFIRSITANGRDVLDDPMDVGESGTSVTVTLTTRGTEINGSVRDARQLPAAGAAILILPVTSKGDAVWTPNRTRETRASMNGGFAVNGLPPGDYMIVAIDDAAAEAWQDARMLATLRTVATRITLRDQETKTLQLRLSNLKR